LAPAVNVSFISEAPGQEAGSFFPGKPLLECEMFESKAKAYPCGALSSPVYLHILDNAGKAGL
jgi:hypothetical protein